jgi:hypothetical protein
MTPLTSREELRDIFIPQFEKILALINDQIQQVNSRFGPRALQVDTHWQIADC